MPERRTVALVTLGCARNEVDSEELAGRLAADGWELVEDAADADVAVVNTCGFVEAAKKDSVDALLEANDLKGARQNPGRGGRRLHGRAVRQGTRRGAARGGRRARLRRLRRHLRPPPDHPQRRHPRLAHPARPAQAAADQPGRAAGAPARGAARPRRDGAGEQPAAARRTCPRASRPPPGRARPLRRRLGSSPGRLGEAGLRLRPALLLLRHPVLPRLLHLPPPLRRAGRDPLAGRAGRQGGHAGLREQHLLRQGPRRHPAAGDAAARAGRRRRHRAGPGQLPPARRDAARADRRPDLAPTKVAPYFDLSFQHSAPGRAARDAPLRRHRPLPGAAGRRSAARRRRRACGPTSSWASPARARPTWRSWSASSPRRGWTPIGVFGYSDEDGTEAAGVRGQARPPTSSPSGSRASRGSPRS